MPAEFRRAEDGREGRGAARLELSTTRLYAQCGIVRAQCACGEEEQGRARPGCQLRQGKGPPTDRPTRVAPYPEGREGEKGKDAEVNCQVQLCTVATVAVLSSPRILERQKI